MNLAAEDRVLVAVPAVAGVVREALSGLTAARARRLERVAQLYLDPHAYLVTARWSLERAQEHLLAADSPTDVVTLPASSALMVRLAVDGLMDDDAPVVEQGLWPALASWSLAVDAALDAA